MTLRFPRVETIRANRAWQAALTDDLFGNPAICQYDEAFAIIQQVRRWSLRSPTALAIFQALDNTDKVINVIGMRSGGYTCFDSDCPSIGQGTCYVDVEAKFNIKSTGVELHNYIAILHEFGHAKQWIENSAWFNIMGRKEGPVSRGDLQNAMASRMLKAGKSANSAPSPSASGPASKGPPPPPPMGGGKGPISMSKAKSDLSAKFGWKDYRPAHIGWPFMIEQDNMARHEWPICDEARYPRRMGYADLIVSYGNS
jgi:hypothetical protein